MKRWNERLAFGALALALLIPISLFQSGIDRDEARVSFLRWIDNQEAYESQALRRVVQSDEERTPEEIALFGRIEETGASLNPDFRELSVEEKWNVLKHPRFNPLYNQFVDLVRQSKASLTEGEIEWANPDVSANVGALVLGFRKLVADMLWLKVDEYWHLGLAQRMLPMMETVVALDPYFIEAYALGAWHLAYNVALLFPSADEKMKYINQGIKLLEKGIKNNPRSSKLYAELGHTIYFRKFSDWEKAAYYLGEATKYEHEPWVERIYGIALERMKEEEKALAVFEDYDRRHPDHISHRLSLNRLRKKREARRLEEEGRLREAFEIWEFLKEDDPTDVVAPIEYARLMVILEQDQTSSRQNSDSETGIE
jgi:tetratricopeptide (TPR) repeat protein